MTEADAPLWTHTVRFDEAFRGLDLTLTADEARRTLIAENFGMIELHALTARITTKGRKSPGSDEVIVDVDLSGEVTQECGVTLDPFRHPIAARIDVVVVAQARKSKADDEETELSVEDLDVPDVAVNGQIDVGQYVIEALGEAYDPFARKPGAVFEEPDQPKEPSPFAVLSRLKGDDA
ncbi:YceD family protein [Asticcacaulis sp. W401b]|uniref:YceD family protein n=1 Tax=Asticcacaulis sp. W401b TaxID=3388666 RepID=UPI0039707AE7